ncbi:HAMP domain-containing methyl-accepting chemotaxis protein [Myxococcaceae bacterium GXIMD 01537]
MARRFQNPGLRGVLLGFFTLALGLTLGALYFIVPAQVESSLRERLAAHGRARAEEVARMLLDGRDLGPRAQEAVSTALDGHVLAADDFLLIAVVDPSGAKVASAARSPLQQREGHASKTTQQPPPSLERVLSEYRLAGLPSSDLVVGGDLLVPALLALPGQVEPGRVLVLVDQSSVEDVVRSLRKTLLVALLAGLGLCVGLVFVLSKLFILRPLDSMMSMARKLAEADLTGRVESANEDEVGKLAEALNRIGHNLRETLGRVRGVSEGVAGVIEQISRTGTTVSSGASTIQSRVEETSSSMVEMLASIRGTAEHAEVLYQSAEASSSSIMQMAATNDEVVENIHAMAASVEETTSAIEEMAFSIREVAKNIDDLSASTEDTSSSISEMDAAIGQVEANANETARLSEQVSEDARTGVDSLLKTLTGIDRIKETSRSAAGVIDSLGRRISEIGNILNVIDDVAEQTNLLALNAAIIAAQAGEHGKGFAVVAEEIKDLAERTGASTKEIAELIRSIQEESRNSVVVMNQGVRNVEEGVLLGREAESALRKINDSAQKSTQMVKAIARATVEQARGSKQVTAAIHRISETVQQIAKASNEQAKGGEQIIKSAERMKALTAHVQRSSQEQAQGSKQITRSIESINEMVTHLNRAQKEQMKGSEQVLKAVETIKGVSEHQTRSVRQLEEAIDGLQKQAEVLRAEVRRFRV